jgi:hypothetical protein
MNRLFLLGLMPLILLLAVPHNAFAWDFGSLLNGFQGQSQGFHHWGFDNNYGQNYQGLGDCGAYCQGERDAVYDHTQGLVYNPTPACCHSEFYQQAFHQGYDDKWNSYQSQESSQGTSINVENSPGAYVVSNQYSSQTQNPLQQLAKTVCGFINCNQQQYLQPSLSPQCEQCLGSDNTNGDCSNGCAWRQEP